VTDLGQPAFIRRDPGNDWIELYARKGIVTLKVTKRMSPGARRTG
jgi:hypothetical protein